MGEFTDTIEDWCDEQIAWIDSVPRQYAEKTGHHAVDITPVITGKLRAGWHIIINSADVRPSSPPDPTGTFTKALISADARRIFWGDRFELVNDVFYAYWVSEGWSRDAQTTESGRFIGAASFEGHKLLDQLLVFVEGLQIERE